MSNSSESEIPRILSLLSAATEIVCRLGCAHLLVGRSHGCDDPPIVTSLPVATAPKVDPNAPSSELDKQVRIQSATGGAIYHINNELVAKLQPTVIITQEQCRICAVTPDDVNAACGADGLSPLIKLVTIMPVSLEDVLGDIVTIAKAIGVEDRGIRLVRHVQRQLAAVNASSMDVLGTSNPRPKVAHVEWLSPLMGSGYWIFDCVKFAGGDMVHGSSGGHSQVLEKCSLLSNAEYIILSPCGFGIERTNAELNNIGILHSKEWNDLPAVKNGKVAIADGNKFFNRSSVASILGTAEMVAEIIYPELCNMYGHHGLHWVRLEELSSFCQRAGAEDVKKDIVLAKGVAVDTDTSKTYSSANGNNSIPIQHVMKQLSTLQLGDYEAAFMLNSPANQKRLVSAEKFKNIVSGWASFKVLTLPSTACTYHGGEVKDTTTHVKVDATATGGDEILSFVFDLSRKSETDERWETDGVRIEC